MRKILISLFLVLLLTVFAGSWLMFVPGARAELSSESDSTFFGGQGDNVYEALGYMGDEDPRVIIANIINVILGFLGVVAVIIILLGGFKWMTAAGNDDKVDEAKKLIYAGAIGLIIILSAWAIAAFVVTAIYNATTK